MNLMINILYWKKKHYNRLLDERTDEIREIAQEIDYNTLIFYVKGPNIAPINFIKHKGPFYIFKDIRDIDKTLQEIEEDQKKFKPSLGQITSRDHEHKDYYQ